MDEHSIQERLMQQENQKLYEELRKARKQLSILSKKGGGRESSGSEFNGRAALRQHEKADYEVSCHI